MKACRRRALPRCYFLLLGFSCYFLLPSAPSGALLYVSHIYNSALTYMGWRLWRTPEPRSFVCERYRDSHHERCGPSCGTGSESCSPPASELHWLPSQPRPSNARLAPTAPRSEWRPGHANKHEHLPHAGRGARAAPGRHLGEASGVRHRGPTNCRCVAGPRWLLDA